MAKARHELPSALQGKVGLFPAETNFQPLGPDWHSGQDIPKPLQLLVGACSEDHIDWGLWKRAVASACFVPSQLPPRALGTMQDHHYKEAGSKLGWCSRLGGPCCIFCWCSNPEMLHRHHGCYLLMLPSLASTGRKIVWEQPSTSCCRREEYSVGRILLPSEYWAVPPLYTLSGWGSVAERSRVWKFCPLLKAAAEKCHQDFTLLPTSYQGFPGSDQHVAGKGSLDYCCETIFARAELFPPRAPPACQEPGWGSRGFLHLSHMFTLLHFPVVQPTEGKKSQKPTTKKKLLLKGRKVLSWSLLNLFTLLEGVWSGCACPLFLLCVLA